MVVTLVRATARLVTGGPPLLLPLLMAAGAEEVVVVVVVVVVVAVVVVVEEAPPASAGCWCSACGAAASCGAPCCASAMRDPKCSTYLPASVKISLAKPCVVRHSRHTKAASCLLAAHAAWLGAQVA